MIVLNVNLHQIIEIIEWMEDTYGLKTPTDFKIAFVKNEEQFKITCTDPKFESLLLLKYSC